MRGYFEQRVVSNFAYLQRRKDLNKRKRMWFGYNCYVWGAAVLHNIEHYTLHKKEKLLHITRMTHTASDFLSLRFTNLSQESIFMLLPHCIELGISETCMAI